MKNLSRYLWLRPATHSSSSSTATQRRASATLLPALLALSQLGTPSGSGAATVWTGPPITFTKVAFADPTQAANQDRLTANVWLTRGGSQGFYNAKTESSFAHLSSPADTEWANGTTANYATLSYTDWNTWAKNINGGPPSTVGIDAVVHLKTDDIYIDIKFTSWGILSGGPFSYTRSTPSVANVPPSIAITNPVAGAIFTAPASFQLAAEASDTDGTVTNVQFFQGDASLGDVASSPYVLPVNNLAAGDYSFLAIATDNSGLTATNLINVQVVAPLSIGPNSCLFIEPAKFQFRAAVMIGRDYVVLRSTDLSPWTAVTTNTPTTNPFLFVDENASPNSAFYRLELLPKP